MLSNLPVDCIYEILKYNIILSQALKLTCKDLNNSVNNTYDISYYPNNIISQYSNMYLIKGKLHFLYIDYNNFDRVLSLLKHNEKCFEIIFINVIFIHKDDIEQIMRFARNIVIPFIYGSDRFYEIFTAFYKYFTVANEKYNMIILEKYRMTRYEYVMLKKRITKTYKFNTSIMLKKMKELLSRTTIRII